MITKHRRLRAGTTVWEAASQPRLQTSRKPLHSFYDVVIVGAGITGALVADALAGRGHSILVLDRRSPATGSTSASTALIQWEIDQPLTGLVKKIGAPAAGRAYKASYKAVRALKARIVARKIACDMLPRDTLLLAGDTMGPKALKSEAAARAKLGLPSRFLDSDTARGIYGFDRAGAILSKGSIELNPKQLALGMLGAALARGVEIVAPCNVTKLEAVSAGAFLTLSDGTAIAARKVIVATGYEALPEIPTRKYDLVSTWALATIKQKPSVFWHKRALVWEASDPYLYFRTTTDNRIIVGGEDAAFLDPARRDGQIRKKAKRILRKFAQLSPDAKLQADFMWAGTFAQSPTGLPVIGPIAELPNVFAILGAGGNGITFSAIASDLAKAWVSGRTHPLAKLFSLAV